MSDTTVVYEPTRWMYGDGSSTKERGFQASRDLAAIAADVEGYLLVHGSVLPTFAINPLVLPDDSRIGVADAARIALRDPTAIFVVGPRWWHGWRDELVPASRLVRLRVSKWGGIYQHAELALADGITVRYRDGRSEHDVEEALRIRYQTGPELVINRSSFGYEIVDGRAAPSLDALLADRWTIRRFTPIVEISSSRLDRDQLLGVLTEAGALHPGPIVINSERWPATPAPGDGS